MAIIIENSFNGDYRTKNNTFLSSKRDGYGIGLSSVSATAKKYGGSANFEAEGVTFKSKVVLYCNQSDIRS